MLSLPAILNSPSSSNARNAQRERRRPTDRRGSSERRRLSLKDAPSDDRRNARDERRSGLDRRVVWGDATPRRFPLEQHLVTGTRLSRIGMHIDLHV